MNLRPYTEAPLKEKAKVVESPLVSVEDNLREKDVTTTADGQEIRTGPEHDGLMMSLKVKEPDLSIDKIMDLKSSLMDNYFLLQGRIMFLGLSVEIDMSVIPGKREEGGGVMIAFKIEWKLGPIPLCEIGGNIDFTPLDIEALTSPSEMKATLLDVELALGIYIEPHIINYALAVIDKIIATALSLIVIPLILAIMILQLALDAMIWVLDMAEKALDAIRGFIDSVRRWCKLTSGS